MGAVDVHSDLCFLADDNEIIFRLAVCRHQTIEKSTLGSVGLFGRGDRKKKLLYAENMLIRSCSCVIVSVITKRSGFINSGRWSHRLIST